MLKLNMKKKILNIFKFENFCGIFSKLNKLTRFLDEITMFDKTMKIVFFRDGIVLIT